MKTFKSEYYSIRSILGNQWAIFFLLIGGRETGKSYTVLEFFLDQFFKSGMKKTFIWIRLTEASTKKLLCNNAMEFIDYKLMEKYKLFEKLSTKGNTVFYKHDDGNVYELAKILALSTFYSDKGVALFKDQELQKEFGISTFNIACDEFQRERSEKRTFDISYSFINQLENLCRHRTDARIFLMGNTVEEASDILTMFKFIPERFGRFKLKSKRCVIDNIAPSEKYINRRKGAIATILSPEASTFTNERRIDYSLIKKGRRIKPTSIIKFTEDKETWFTLWDGNIISAYNKEKINSIIYMRPLIGGVFKKEIVEEILSIVYLRGLFYSDLFIEKNFEKHIKLLKGLK